MNNKTQFRIGFFLIFTLFLGGKCLLFSQRIVTLAPALTELVFTLGKGDQIVGNTRFCDFPDRAKNIFHVGGMIDLNIEAMVSIKPDIVFLYPEIMPKLDFMKNQTHLVVVPHNTLSDLYESIAIVSRELKTESNGRLLEKKIREDLSKIKKIATSRRCLIVMGRTQDDFRNMYIMGKNDFLNEILEMCGGKNVYNGNIPYPLISLESVLSFNPDVIFEISAYYENINQDWLLSRWQEQRMISAVKNKKIFVIKNSVWLRPGPRVGIIAQELSQMLNND